MDHDINPYASPSEKTERQPKPRKPVSLVGVFVVFAELAFLTLLFAPGQPHPDPYSPLEEVLLQLSSSWLTIIVYIVTVATIGTLIFVSVRRVTQSHREPSTR